MKLRFLSHPWGVPVLGWLIVVGVSVVIEVEQRAFVANQALIHADHAVPSEYQMALHALNELIVLAQAGGRVDADELERRVAVLHAKMRLMTVERESTAYLRNLATFEAFKQRMQEAQDKMAILALSPPEALSDGLTQLHAFSQALMDDVDEFRRDVNGAEGERQRMALLHMMRLQRELWGAVILVTLMLGWWLRRWVLSEREHQRLAAERQVALDRERVAQKQLARSLEERVTFLSLVSHDVRSTLQGMVSGLGGVRRTVSGAEDADWVERITRMALTLGRQLGDVMTLARGDVGQLHVHPCVFDVCEWVRAQVDEHREAAAAKALQIVCTTAPDNALVWADDARLSQVLSHLLSNAIKYTDSGSVRVSLCLVDPHHAADALPLKTGEDGVPRAQRWLCLQVHDTGRGMTEDCQAQMFKPFHRAGDRVQGMELGLSVVQRVVQVMAGTIRVQSQVGLGTRVEVRVPVSTVDMGQDEALAERLAQGHEGSAVSQALALHPGYPPQADHPAVHAAVQTMACPAVSPHWLVVDDDAEALDALCQLGASCGLTVEAVATWTQARQRVAALWALGRVHDVMVFALSMPEGHGAVLAAECRQAQAMRYRAEAGGELAVLGPTRSTVFVSIGSGRHGGDGPAGVFDLHVNKPVDRAQWDALLAQMTARQGGVQEATLI